MTETTDTTSTTETSTTADASRSPRVERAMENLLTIGRLWATHGIEIGRSALATSAESLRLASETLGDLKGRLSGEPEAEAARPTDGHAH